MACQLNNYSIGVFAILSNEKKQNFTGQALTTNAFIEEEKNVIIQKSLLTSSITKKSHEDLTRLNVLNIFITQRLYAASLFSGSLDSSF